MALEKFDKDCLFKILAKKIHKHVEIISGFGIRYAGSDADRKTIDYLADTLKSYGLKVTREQFDALCFEENITNFAIVVPERKNIDCRAMAFSPSTIQPTTSELVYVGRGRNEDYFAKDVSGKIVLFERDPNKEKDSYFEEVARAASKGAVGCVMVNYKPWIFVATLESGLFEAEKRFLPNTKLIPAIVISSVDGAHLKYLLRKWQVKSTLVVDTAIKGKKTENVRAFLEGKELSDEKIIICAHHDAEGTAGANDNASGLAVMLEIARVLSSYKPRRTIEFLATGAEEISSFGSWCYCQNHKDELDKVKAVINVDMVGVGGDLFLIKEGHWPDKILKTPEWLYKFVKKVAESLGYVIKLGVCQLGTSDEGRFLAEGVPALFIWKPGDKYYHSPHDTSEKVDANALKVVTEIIMTSVWKLANMKELPKNQKSKGRQ